MSAAVEIVGGGLAGLSLARALRRAGVEVVVDEAGQYPRHRVCGEFITGLDAETIDRLDLAPILSGALRHTEVTWFIGGRAARTEQLPAPALGLSRYALDARLAERFVAEGGCLRTGVRVSDEPAPGRVYATGRRRAASDWIGLKIHARAIPLARDLEFHLGENAYVGLSRVEDGVTNVCGLFRRQRPADKTGAPTLAPAAVGPPDPGNAGERRGQESPPYHVLFEYLDTCGLAELAARLRAADIDADSFCAVAALPFGDTGSAAPIDRICLGDAFAMIPPFTGNGMAMAFQSAAVALGPLRQFAHDRATWDETCRATQRALRGRFRVRLASADALHSFLLRPHRQRWFAALSRARLLPFRPLYAVLH